MISENMIYNPYFGENLCNLLANSIVEEIKSDNPKHFVDISVSNVSEFLIVFGKTSSTKKINLTELFNNFMDTIPESMRIIIKVFDMVSYGVERETTTIFYSNTYNKEFKDYTDSFDEYQQILNWNRQGLYTNIKVFKNNKYVNVVFNESHLEIPSEYTELLSANKTFKSDPIFGKDIRSVKYFHMLSKYIAHTLFESNICKDVTINLSTDSSINDINWETINLSIESNSFLYNKNWVESLVLDIFDFEPEKVISHLNLDNYNFSNEILQENTNYPWLKRDRLRDIRFV